MRRSFCRIITGVVVVVLFTCSTVNGADKTSLPVSAFISRAQVANIDLPYTPGVMWRAEVTAEQGTAALKAAYRFIDTPYAWGGHAKTGIDCSGLVIEAYRSAMPGLRLQTWGKPISDDACALDLYYYNTVQVALSELREGDLIFTTNGKGPHPVSHVLMVKTLSKGLVTFINATTRYGRVVEETWDINSAIWKQSYVGTGRLFNIIGCDLGVD